MSKTCTEDWDPQGTLSRCLDGGYGRTWLVSEKRSVALLDSGRLNCVYFLNYTTRAWRSNGAKFKLTFPDGPTRDAFKGMIAAIKAEGEINRVNGILGFLEGDTHEITEIIPFGPEGLNLIVKDEVACNDDDIVLKLPIDLIKIVNDLIDYSSPEQGSVFSSLWLYEGELIYLGQHFVFRARNLCMGVNIPQEHDIPLRLDSRDFTDRSQGHELVLRDICDRVSARHALPDMVEYKFGQLQSGDVEAEKEKREKFLKAWKMIREQDISNDAITARVSIAPFYLRILGQLGELAGYRGKGINLKFRGEEELISWSFKPATDRTPALTGVVMPMQIRD